MASILKNSSVKNVLARSYSAQASLNANSAHNQDAIFEEKPRRKVSTVKNIVVASIENFSPLTSIAFLYKSGPRYETRDNLGVSHALRKFAGFSTLSYSSFGVTRNFQQVGAKFYCQSGREHMLYGVSVLRDYSIGCFKLLAECSMDHTFKHWELDRSRNHLIYDKAVMDHPTLLMEMLHQITYRSKGLGNSLFMPDHRQGNFDAQEISQFIEDTHTRDRMAVVGIGIDHNVLSKWVSRITPHEGDGADIGLNASKYEGGLDIRQETHGPLAYVAVAGSGAKFGTPEAASLAVAAAILGTEHGVKNFPNVVNRLDKLSSTISAAGGSGHAVPININYSDSGLFGFLLVEKASKAGEITRAIVNTIRTLKVTDIDIKQAIVKVKSTVFMNSEEHGSEMEDMGMQALFLRNHTPFSDSVLENVTVASVQSAISTMLKSKPSMAAYGGINEVPYVDQL